MSLHDSRAIYSRYQACSCMQRRKPRTTAPRQLWLKAGRTVTILFLACTLPVRDTNWNIMGHPQFTELFKKKKKPRAHFLLVLSDVLLILQPQIWLLGDLLSYKLCCIPLTLHVTHLNNNKFYLHMNWQSIPWLIVLKQSEREKKK